MFPACPAAMLPTLWPKNLKFPILTGSDQVRLVMLSSTVGLFYNLSGCDVVVLNHGWLGSAFRQDGYSAGQDRNCVRQAIQTHNRTVTRWAQPRSGYRVMKGR